MQTHWSLLRGGQCRQDLLKVLKREQQFQVTFKWKGKNGDKKMEENFALSSHRCVMETSFHIPSFV